MCVCVLIGDAIANFHDLLALQDVTVIASSHPHENVGVKSSADACRAECETKATCVGWTWHATTDTCRGGINPAQLNLCYLMSKEYVSPQNCQGHVSGYLAPPLAKPSARQLEFMEMELSQFMHFGIPTFWDPPVEYLYGGNPTYHDCYTTTIDHSNQTGSYYPCLDPLIFNPTDFDADNWMESSAAMGMKEICLTAHHEGGFALWPSKYTNYSVARSLRWKGGKGVSVFVSGQNAFEIKGRPVRTPNVPPGMC